MNNSKVIYGINVEDIQGVASKVLDRNLSNEEIALIEESVGDHIDWFQAIENAINDNIDE